MNNDPIVEEIRAIREEFAASLGYDIKRIFEAIKEHEKAGKAGSAIQVSFPPRPAQPPIERRKSA
jgi:hypothetical protein